MADYAGRTFEYVEKAELKPAKEKVEEIIKDLQNNLRNENITFNPKLIGSGGKNLVTRAVGGNAGFDFDYNFIIQKDSDLGPKDLKLLFIQELEDVIQNTQYSNVSNGKQSMVIKVVDKKNSRILHGCDFAIVNEYIGDDDESHQEILIRNKTTDVYTWNEKPSAKNYTSKVSNLKANGLWNEVRDEYLKLKNNNNDEGKKSFTLFYEAVNNVYSRYNWV